jgi:transcriptional regulator with XRE-family HTH domain
MTGEEMKSIRHRLGLSAVELGRAMGYTGADNTVSVTVRRYESDMRPIPPWLSRLLLMFEMHGVPRGWTSRLPLSTSTDEARYPPEDLGYPQEDEE